MVLDHGSLADAMRATMSLPGVFPPMELDGKVLVDGGAMNNVPADVVREMGADVVIAINVGFMGDTRDVNYSLFGLMGQTVDVMMQANTRIAMEAPTSSSTRRSMDTAASTGAAAKSWPTTATSAAEAMKDKLLPLALDEQAWTAYQAARQARRQSQLPSPQFVTISGAVSGDERRMQEVLQAHVGQPLDLAVLETELETFAGLDRYETVGWQLVEENGRQGLLIRARPKAYAPPFLMLGVSPGKHDDRRLRVPARRALSHVRRRRLRLRAPRRRRRRRAAEGWRRAVSANRAVALLRLAVRARSGRPPELHPGRRDHRAVRRDPRAAWASMWA